MPKKPIPDSMACPVCGGGPTVRDVQPMSIEYKGHAVTVDQPGYTCAQCKERTFVGADNDVWEFAHTVLRDTVDGTLSPVTVRAIRKGLGLTQEQAGTAIGGGPKAFAKYESASTSIRPSRAMDHLLLALAIHPDLVGRLTPADPEVLQFLERGAPADIAAAIARVREAAAK